MTPEDLAALHARCFETPRPWRAEEFSGLLNDEAVFLCLRQGGVALGRTAADEAELLTLAVEPGQRGRGIGKDLLRAFEQEAMARSALTAHLEVSTENTTARKLYLAAGYAESGCRPKYFKTPDGRRIDAVVMVKTLIPDQFPPVSPT